MCEQEELELDDVKIYAREEAINKVYDRAKLWVLCHKISKRGNSIIVKMSNLSNADGFLDYNKFYIAFSLRNGELKFDFNFKDIVDNSDVWFIVFFVENLTRLLEAEIDEHYADVKMSIRTKPYVYERKRRSRLYLARGEIKAKMLYISFRPVGKEEMLFNVNGRLSISRRDSLIDLIKDFSIAV